MRIKIPKWTQEIEGNSAAAVLDILREMSLLPDPNLATYKMALRKRLGAWFGYKVNTDSSEELIRLMEQAGAIVVLKS